MGLTVDDLCKRAAQLTSVSDATGTDDRELLDGWVNEGIAQVFQDTQSVVTQVNVTLTAGVDEYAIDRGILTVLNYAQSTANPSAKISQIPAQDILERRFLASTGEIRYFSVLGGNILIFSPTPSAAQVIHFYVVPVPDAIATSADLADTGLPTYAERAVECYVYEKCFEQQRDYQSAQYWAAQYNAECGNVRKTMRRQGGRTLPAGRIGYPDRYATPSRNDTYPRV